MAKTRTVYSTQDDGAGTLRDALRVTASYTSEWIDAGALENGDIINFSDAIEDSQTGVITILLSSQLSLPATDITIDGGSHTGSGATLTTRVVLDAQQLGRVIYGTTANKVEFYNVTFKDGKLTGSNYGACVYTRNSAASGKNVFEYCVFKQTYSGSAATYGGGLYSASASQNTLTNCTFDSCTATTYGGGLYSVSASQNSLTNCTFDSCTAANYGGGLCSYNTSQNTLTNCTFDSCTAANYGGGLYSVSTSQNTLTNCTFDSCTAANYGGGLYSTSTSQNTLTNCTFDSCTAANYGGGLCSTATSQNTLADCVFIPPENNTKSTIYNNGTNTNGSLIINGATTCDSVQFAANSTTFINGKLTADTLTINNGASVTFSGVDSILAATTTATIGSSTFTAADNSTGYAAFPTGTNISSATFGTGVTACTYGAGIESASLSKTTVTWTATNLSTDILIEQQNGDSWTTLTTTGTGGSYSGTFGEGTTVRLFDGVAFWYASTQFPYWVVNSFAVTNNDWIVTPYAISTNGGGGTDPVTGDPLPSWTVNTADITPNFKGL